MDKSPVNINMAEMAKAVQAFVRSRAIRSGSAIIYQENVHIVKEDPRTGEKTIISSTPNK
jgi:hypothetical protein